MKKVLAFIVAIAAVILMGWSIRENEKFSCDGSTVTVVKDDTMWKIIEDHCTGNKESARNYLVKKYDVMLQPGDIIQLP